MSKAQSPYEELLDRRGGRPRKYDPKTAQDRQREQTKRYNEARRRTFAVLADRYNEEYKEIFAQELKTVNKAAGPLPGDA